MTNTFCTIITADYYPKALTLYKSIKTYNPDIELQVLVADDKPVSKAFSVPAGITIIPVNRLSGYSLVNSLYKKYAHIEMDFFRWSLKPVFISYLLENGFEKVMYIDCDMFFFNDYNFLFSELDNSSVLLTPHWENSEPLVNKDSFFTLFTNGFFPAGFIGVNKKGIAAMRWWANACHFMMGSHVNYGIHDDQKYLDIFPVKFEGTKIIRHRGCNVGAWNYEECKRESVNGEVLINGRFPVIFIHFDGMMIRGIMRGHDNLLSPHFALYKKNFEESGVKLSDFINEIDTHANAGLLVRGKWRLKLRTRLKKFFYKLAEKL
jgi:hypothetical protein